MNQHTPGPWKWQRGERWWRLCAGVEGTPKALKRVLVVDQKSGSRIYPINHADARLIATAPEMYDLLQSVSDHFGVDAYHDSEVVIQWQKRAHALLARIEGAKP